MLRVPQKADANYPQEPHLEGSTENAPHRIARTIAAHWGVLKTSTIPASEVRRRTPRCPLPEDAEGR